MRKTRKPKKRSHRTETEQRGRFLRGEKFGAPGKRPTSRAEPTPVGRVVGSGPAPAVTDAYRDGWDRIFGARSESAT